MGRSRLTRVAKKLIFGGNSFCGFGILLLKEDWRCLEKLCSMLTMAIPDVETLAVHLFAVCFSVFASLSKITAVLIYE